MTTINDIRTGLQRLLPAGEFPESLPMNYEILHRTLDDPKWRTVEMTKPSTGESVPAVFAREESAERVLWDDWGLAVDDMTGIWCPPSGTDEYRIIGTARPAYFTD